MNMKKKEIEIKQRLNRLKREYECITCEVVVPKKLVVQPMSVVQGKCGITEVATMIRNLEDISEYLKNTFPEVRTILPELRERYKVQEVYKCIAQERRN